MRTYYTTAEAARIAGVGLKAMRAACSRGEVAHKTQGRAYLIEDRALEEYARRRQGKRSRHE